MPKRQTVDPINNALDAFFRGLWSLIRYPFRGRTAKGRLVQAKVEFTANWARIEAGSDRRQAILNADILLDKALQFYGLPGTTLGERLKGATHRLDKETLDRAWRAHKVRNQLAHELDYALGEAEARQTLIDFKRVLGVLGLLQ